MITFRKGHPHVAFLTKTWQVMTFRAAESHSSTRKTFFLAMKLTAILMVGICLQAAAVKACAAYYLRRKKCVFE